jgi:cell division protein FtsQ
MSRGGRLRMIMSGVRTFGLVLLAAAVGVGVWMIARTLRENPRDTAAVARATPMKPPELETTREGVLDNAWLARTLELPPGVSLMELDLARLQARLMADQQVLSASLTRHFPDRLKVQITERMPIARARIEVGGIRRDMLVARDGIVFAGSGHDPALLVSLPWLDGIRLSREGLGFRANADMEAVARLLSAAQFSAPHLYQSWQSVSLTRLASDRELEVATKQGVTIVFSAKGEYFLQLAKLDYMVERLGRVPGGRARIDLSLGREVPLTISPAGRPISLTTAAPLSTRTSSLPPRP